MTPERLAELRAKWPATYADVCDHIDALQAEIDTWKGVSAVDVKNNLEFTTVKKQDLLSILRTNRDEHRSQFLKALDGYKFRLEEELSRRLEDVQAGRKVNVMVNLPEPEDHTKDYERVIKMLEMEQDEVVTIDAQHFASFVMDDWSWKERTLQTNAVYAALASRHA